MNWNVFPAPAETMFVEYLQGLARAYHAQDQPPASLDEWKARKAELRAHLARSFGFSGESGTFVPDYQPGTPLEARIAGTIERENYRIERVAFQSRPHVYVTANLYVPTPPASQPPSQGGAGESSPPLVKGGQGGVRMPGVLGVHGHWATGKIEAVVQSRALGLVQRGYVVLNVDAIGAGERGRTPGQFEYHGARLGAGLWPVGTPLIGMQVYDNIRALDYLCSRPEVDPTRIGCTGASGGGNQTMWIAAFDERIQAAVPVCSVGTFESYVGSANCVCETMPGGLTYAEEGDVLALVAPRALLLINATQDARCFSVGEMRRSFARAQEVFRLFGVTEKLAKCEVEAGHGYNQPMREAMYGWFDRWLKGEGDGRPVPEPQLQTEDPAALKCFPDDVRPDDFATIPSFAYHRGQSLRQVRSEEWQAGAGGGPNLFGAFREAKRRELAERWFVVRHVGAVAEDATSVADYKRVPLEVEAAGTLESHSATVEKLSFLTEPGLRLPGLFFRPLPGPPPTQGREPSPQGVTILLHPDGKAAAAESGLCRELLAQGQAVFTFDLRGTGETRWPGDALGDVPDHNSSRAALWLGRPLLAMWVWDVRRAIDYLATRDDVVGASLVDARRVAVCGVGPMGLVALFTAALDERCASVASVGALATYVQPDGYPAQPMGVLLPGILEWGDVAHVAALVAPRRLILANGVNGAGQAVEEATLNALYADTAVWYHQTNADGSLAVRVEATDADVAAWLASG